MKACLIGVAAACFAVAPAWGQTPDPGAQQAIAQIEAIGGRVYRSAKGEADIVAIQGQQVTDAHLDLLQALPTVRILDLDGSQVTDAGLERLLLLPRLEEVSLRHTAVTSAAAASFKDRHPGVYRVELSKRWRPERLAFAAVTLIPLGIGVWLISAAQQKRHVLTSRLYSRAVMWGAILAVGSLLLLVVAILQAVGIDFRLADFGG